MTMTKEELYELMEDGNLGYACVFKREDQGTHTDYMFNRGTANAENHSLKETGCEIGVLKFQRLMYLKPEWAEHVKMCIQKGNEK